MQCTFRSSAMVALTAALAAAAPHFACAQAYPAKTIRYVIPFPPGGITDLMARTIAQKTADAWKQSVVIDNRPGGNALTGADIVAKSTPDGYTWLGMTITHTVNATLFPQAPYNFTQDLTAVTVLGSLPLVTVVPQSLPVKSLAELTQLSRTRSLNGGSSGNGTPQHLAFELYRQIAGVNAQHIPFKGGGPSTIALIGGHVDFITTGLPECLPHIRSGKLRALAVAGAARLTAIPDVPTTAELGMPALAITSWTGLMVPAATPRHIVARINSEVTGVLRQPDIAERVREQGFDIVANSPQAAQAFMAAEVERWGRLVREANIKAD
ncbi:MAG: tripartite tricarboxylate transporter substrate binding protein [Burkholderiales bacterium]